MAAKKKDKRLARGLAARRKRRRRTKPGSRPGLTSVDPQASSTTLSVLAYGRDGFVEKKPESFKELPAFLESYPTTWVHIEGLGDADTLQSLADMFRLHPLALEDVVLPQRPKAEAYPDQVLLVFWTLKYQEALLPEQISLFIGPNFVLTFQEHSGDPFEPVRERLRVGSGRIRQNGSDYLAYALLDAAIDHYFPILDEMRDRLEELESELRFLHVDAAVEHIRRARSEVLEARRSVSPMREVLRSLLGDDQPLITDHTRTYLRDCRDHVLEAAEIIDSCRDIASGLMDIHLSTVSHQANQTMKVLTVIATIFMPLSFLAGLYGMNFDTSVSPWNMPELRSPLGYPALLTAMGFVGFGLLFLFWRKGWFR